MSGIEIAVIAGASMGAVNTLVNAANNAPGILLRIKLWALSVWGYRIIIRRSNNEMKYREIAGLLDDKKSDLDDVEMITTQFRVGDKIEEKRLFLPVYNSHVDMTVGPENINATVYRIFENGQDTFYMYTWRQEDNLALRRLLSA